MATFSFSVPDSVYAEAKLWADREGVSLEYWIIAAVEREGLRRRLHNHADWAKDNPIYPEDRWWAIQKLIADAAGNAQHRDAA